MVIVFFSATAAGDVLSVHCPLGCPSVAIGNDVVFGHVYALSNNPDTKFADWVAYEVNVLNFGPSPGRVWKADPLIEGDKTLEEDDYRGANASALEADRGHQAPLASFAGSHYWPELNYLSNITPQDRDLNQGPWLGLEEAVRNAVSYGNSLYVITGPIYGLSMVTLPNADEPHLVPSGYFKVVYDKDRLGAGFVMQQNVDRGKDYCETKDSLLDIEALSGVKLPLLIESSIIYQRLGC